MVRLERREREREREREIVQNDTQTDRFSVTQTVIDGWIDR